MNTPDTLASLIAKMPCFRAYWKTETGESVLYEPENCDCFKHQAQAALDALAARWEKPFVRLDSYMDGYNYALQDCAAELRGIREKV